ncbi:MAG: YicC family protein [Bdellovibrionaceae bacterium]|nr:YicC family protein [Pseudobdellovibrionaceae bacterium]
MKSMTGFATDFVEHKTSGKKIELKIKSVNNRFFEFRLHTVPEFLEYEIEVRKLVQSQIHRGSVDVFMYYKKDTSSDRGENTFIDANIAESFLKQSQKLAKKLKLKSDIELADVLKLSGAVQVQRQEIKWDKKNILKALQTLLTSFEQEREREGLALKQEVLGLLTELEAIRGRIEALAQDLPDEVQKRLQDKIKNFKEDVDPMRLQQEILFYIDKSDIKEELVRLKEHIRACKDLVQAKSPEGKKLDFYAQELFREMNTVGSKSSSVKITGEVLQGKAIIEKIRQQVQNIE